VDSSSRDAWPAIVSRDSRIHHDHQRVFLLFGHLPLDCTTTGSSPSTCPRQKTPPITGVLGREPVSRCVTGR